MSDPSRAWDAALVRKWLERRLAASKLDEAAADRRGYEAKVGYDKAAAGSAARCKPQVALTSKRRSPASKGIDRAGGISGCRFAHAGS